VSLRRDTEKPSPTPSPAPVVVPSVPVPDLDPPPTGSADPWAEAPPPPVKPPAKPAPTTVGPTCADHPPKDLMDVECMRQYCAAHPFKCVNQFCKGSSCNYP
jgi:hypothetical protein